MLKRYITEIQQLYYGNSWLAEDFEKKLKPLNEQTAFIRPADDVHSVAEVVSHIVEWRKELIYRFQTGGAARLKMESAGNWISNQALKEQGWAYLYDQLKQTQQELVDLLQQKDDEFVDKEWRDGESYEWLLAGLVQHDAYHLGQIGLIWKMIPESIKTQ